MLLNIQIPITYSVCTDEIGYSLSNSDNMLYKRSCENETKIHKARNASVVDA